MAINDGDSAFPHMGGAPGMTLRDYFAAKALEGLVGAAAFSQPAEDMMKKAGVFKTQDGPEVIEDFIAFLAYGFADAMIRQRDAEGKEQG